VKNELDFYIPEDGILHRNRRENLNSYNMFLAVRFADFRMSRRFGEDNHLFVVGALSIIHYSY
jgi:hypothetical protein